MVLSDLKSLEKRFEPNDLHPPPGGENSNFQNTQEVILANATKPHE